MWNVGIKEGFIKGGTITGGHCDQAIVIDLLKSVGLTAYLEYDSYRCGHTFVMVRCSESDNIRNPLHDVELA
eukprot:46562-Eustigmatos_ZCMA.PRE.1